MNRTQKQVREFMVRAGQKCPVSPCIPKLSVCMLRVQLIREEFEELVDAMIKEHVVEAADAIGDLLVVVYGTAVACGIDMEPIMEEIHRSNMSKFVDCTYREDGKVIKGPSYIPPDLKPILEMQA